MSTQPIPVEVEAGKTYWWCACGASKNQPFCDGSHKTAGGGPLAWEAPESRTVWMCACKKTGAPPLCDGSHTKL